MKPETDLKRGSDRRRRAWLLANRGTLMVVGLTWISMIVWELSRGRVPLFLIAMVPAFALLRAGLFLYYLSTSDETNRRADKGAS